MVRCVSFGIENKDDRKFCANCGANLSSITKSRRKKEDKCFGLPNSGAIASLLIGILGLSWVFGWEINYMAYFVVVFGVLIVAGAIYKLARKKKCTDKRAHREYKSLN